MLLPATGAAASLMYGQDGSAAAEAVVAAAVEDARDAQQRQRASAHDARLAGDVQLASVAQIRAVQHHAAVILK